MEQFDSLGAAYDYEKGIDFETIKSKYDREKFIGDANAERRVNRRTLQNEQVKSLDMYLDGMGLKSIKYELESRGRLTAMGKTQWFESVISKVLRNSFYCGIMTYHKYYCPDYLKQNRVKNMGEIEMTYTKGTHEPIVTEEEFNLVQARIDIVNIG